MAEGNCQFIVGIIVAASFIEAIAADDFFGADSLPESQRVIVYQALIYGAIACIGILIIGILVTICVWAYLRHKANMHPVGIALPTHSYRSGYSQLDKYHHDEEQPPAPVNTNAPGRR